MRVKTFNVLPNTPEQLQPLVELSKNLWYSWNWEALQLFKKLDHENWKISGSSPVRMLNTVSHDSLENAIADHTFMTELSTVYNRFKKYLESKETWYQAQYPSLPGKIAYFCLEFGIHESLPIYSGGLGILAGDHLKSASDLNLPLIGVGLFYREGYFTQYLNADGMQQESYFEYAYTDMPMSPVLNQEGKPLIMEMKIGGDNVKFKIWEVMVGRIKLFLLDTNLQENEENIRNITRRLYVGDRSRRLQQEILLGIGGVRVLEELGIEPSVYHMNEGHSALLSLERISQLLKKGLSLEEAKEYIWSTSVFTTHTPVPAGNEFFDPNLMQPFIGEYIYQLGISWDEFMHLGKIHHDNHNEHFCMTVLALKLSAFSNGVAKLHGKVSREMWQDVFPGLPKNEIPIGSITNGVHARKWLSPEMNNLLKRYSTNVLDDSLADIDMWESIDRIPDESLWDIHMLRKKKLINFVRYHMAKSMKARNHSADEIAAVQNIFDPEVLTIGFARRFATYKRGDMILRDQKRLLNIINSSTKPVQIIVAGKAHPADQFGKDLIRNIYQFALKPESNHRIVFLENYDMLVARFMVQGVDVWLNNPVRPLEASGTSGMKAAINGVPNLSVLDGWWDEAYTSKVGWAIGNREEYDDFDKSAEIESHLLYRELEKNIIPLFYERDEKGLPRGWIKMMKKSIQVLGKKFNTHRMLMDYTNKYYAKASKLHEKLVNNQFAATKDLNNWKQKIIHEWHQIEVIDISNNVNASIKVDQELVVEAKVKLGSLSPDNLIVEIYHGNVNNLGVIENGNREKMSLKSSDSDVHTFAGKFVCENGGQYGYTVRVLPGHKNLAVEFLPGYMKWA